MKSFHRHRHHYGYYYLWVITVSSHLFGGHSNLTAAATIPPPPPPPPPPLPPQGRSSGTSITQRSDFVTEESVKSNPDQHSYGSGVMDDHENVNTTDGMIQQSLRPPLPPPPPPPPPRSTNNAKGQYNYQTIQSIQGEDKEKYKDQEEEEEAIEEEEVSWMVPPHLQFQRQPEESSVPPRLHQPPPALPSHPGMTQQSVSQTRQQHPWSTSQSRPLYPQRPMTPPPPPPPRTYPQSTQMLAPRTYNYHRRPLSPEEVDRGSQETGALVPHRPPTPPPLQGFGKSILERFGKSLDAISDVDTLLSKKAQQVIKNVATSSDHIAGSVSGAMRKTVFSSIDGVTGIKESIKDQVRGRVSSIFGGAPTMATEARDEWEDDRRRTVSENRRKKILGTTESARGSGPGETYTGSGESPLQQHLYGLMQKDGTAGEDASVGMGDDGVSTPRDEDQGGPLQEWTVKEGEEEGSSGGAGGGVSGARVSELEEAMPPSNVNPYAMLVYPAAEHILEDESSDVDNDDHDETVDPSTFFVSTPSARDHVRRSSPASFDIEDEQLTILQKASKFFRIPTLNFPHLLRRNRGVFSNFDDSAWSDEDWATPTSKRTISVQTNQIPKVARKSFVKAESPMEDIIERYQSSSPVAKASTANILSSHDIHQLVHLGRSKAFTDFMALSFMYAFLLECLEAVGGAFSAQRWLVPKNLDDMAMFLRQIYSTVAITDVNILDTWAPYALIAYALSICTRNVLIEPRSQKLTRSLSESMESTVEKAQLYLRLVSGVPIKYDLMKTFSTAVKSQSLAVVEIARLRTFVSFTFIAWLATTVAVFKPVCTNLLMAAVDILSVNELHTWPIEWSSLAVNLKLIATSLAHNMLELLEKELQKLSSNPFGIISSASFVITLLLLSQVSVLERRRSVHAATGLPPAPDMMATHDRHVRSLEKISNVGASSASRLRIHMEDGALERIMLNILPDRSSRSKLPEDIVLGKNSMLLRKVLFSVLCGALTMLPLCVHLMVCNLNGLPLESSHFVGLLLMLYFANNLTRRAIFSTIDASRQMLQMSPFLKVLSDTAKEVESIKNQASHFPTTSFSSKGLDVKDLWVAHARKRAWACRGINLTCKAGEVVAILGDESSGKTRLLASIGELVARPPKRSRTTTLARGNILIGGTHIHKWNINELKRKVGIMLNDAKTLSDMSQIFSGMKLGDILKPTCPAGTHEGALGSSVDVAMDITGLSKNVLSRLPMKLDTIVTANEDDLNDSNQDKAFLSAAEWSKILLTKLIAQAILTNDNPTSTINSLSKSLVGSILLLDDVTNYLNEVEETKLIKALKNSGAATLMTSNRWAIGRFANRILVLQNGSIIESGTHSELISKGAANSFYAARWAQMMSS